MANTSATSESSPAQAARYHHLAPKPGSNYQQLFVNGRIRAEILYRETIGTEPLTPEQVADEYDVPVAAVLESIAYCRENQSLLNAERDRESVRIEASGRDVWPYAPMADAPGE